MLALTFDVRPIRWAACRAIGFLRPSVYWSWLSGLKLRELPAPELPGDDWVRLRTVYGGICGTDLMSVFQRNHPATSLRAFSSFPAVLGHENVAVIERVGPQVAGFRLGQRVCVEPALSCAPRGITPLCQPCGEGLIALCENVAGDSVEGRVPVPRGAGRMPAVQETGRPPPRLARGEMPTVQEAGRMPAVRGAGAIIGMNRFTGGSWGESFVAHASQLHPVPDAIDDLTAALVDPIACALHAVLRRRPLADERVLVIGAGIIALGLVRCLRAVDCKAHVTSLVRRNVQAHRMRASGADDVLVVPPRCSNAERYDMVAKAVGGQRIPILFGNQAFIGGYDLVYECVGSGQSLTDAMKFTRARGTVVEVGTSQIGVYETTPLWFKELTVLGASGRQIEDFEGRRAHTYEIVFELLIRKRLALDGLLTHTFPLRAYRAAFATLADRARSDVVKVAFDHTA